VRTQKARSRENGNFRPSDPVSPTSEANAWGSPPPSIAQTLATDLEKSPVAETVIDTSLDVASGKGKDKEGLAVAVRKFRGVPEDVQLFEVFWTQVVELIKV
jgi:vacuolar protein sorting-associated protein 35